MAHRPLQKRFTEQGIERLNYDPAVAPPSGRMEIEDAVCPGLLLRVTPRGVKSFSVIYKVPGEGGTNANGRLIVGSQHRITLGSTPRFSSRQRENRLAKLSSLQRRVEILGMIVANEISSDTVTSLRPRRSGSSNERLNPISRHGKLSRVYCACMLSRIGATGRSRNSPLRCARVA